MPATMNAKGTAGETTLSGGHIFKWLMTGTTTPEIWGYIDKDWDKLPKSDGYWRTTDPVEAAKRAASAFGLEIEV